MAFNAVTMLWASSLAVLRSCEAVFISPRPVWIAWLF